ncbi:D-glycerate dehydrogenase [Roseospira marina]|uniref:D-glycerate dehydrogenase n=1 Tax=Roseospira marina TaxID=140057 RepID=A0A5M6I7B4_9PROT|nr:D-glycerate dehydrogenase [Roseospira marina]KAA5604154.1 D-glycerate dehydrogenase [Roseospira marina]MBB4315749.1 lactate dehydrogenase-like 2-hydroxyacid dehydrogenase [Roseospira marina]MBB5088916.1 lactate dehydrogenase-like 2-hydroxyacid dehydrogenase [Roseospira marina]
MTAKPVLALARTLPDDVEARAARDYDVRAAPVDTPALGGEALVAHADGADGLLVAPGNAVTAEVIQALPDCVRVIATFSVGFDHIDLDAARARGLIVTNTPDVLTDATADIAMLCMLGAARRAGEGEAMMRAGEWIGWAPTQMMGVQVTGKRLGIIGMGRIGRAVAKRARAFDMTIHYQDSKKLDTAVVGDAIYHATVEDLLPHCDFVSLHCPATPETTKLMNAERLALLPKGAVLVNTARGTVVDDEAVIAALKSGQLAAAGLDVFTGEPNVHPGYRDQPNTFLLPHLGSATIETRNAMGFRALDNLDAVLLRGEAPGDRVV